MYHNMNIIGADHLYDLGTLPWVHYRDYGVLAKLSNTNVLTGLSLCKPINDLGRATPTKTVVANVILTM